MAKLSVLNVKRRGSSIVLSKVHAFVILNSFYPQMVPVSFLNSLVKTMNNLLMDYAFPSFSHFLNSAILPLRSIT